MRQLLCPSLVGRQAEMQLLEGSLRQAGAGRGGVVLLSGEAGVGKSRLARETVASARRQGFSVLVGRAMDSCTPSAFGPITEAFLTYFRTSGPPDVPELQAFKPALARVVPHWRPEVPRPADDSVVVLAEAVLRLLATIAGQRGCLLILEDLHWADPETLAIVDYFSDTLDTERVLCVGSLRSNEPGRASALQASMHTRRSGLVHELRRLDDARVRSMARACLGSEGSAEAYDAIAEFADGVPFLVEELLAAWADAGNLVLSDAGWSLTPHAEPVVPRTFADTVCGRLRAMGGSARLILGAGAVLGPRFDWRLVVTATGLDEEAVLETLRHAVTAQLCVSQTLHNDDFRFRHALTRHAVLAELLPAERQHLAGKLLNALEDAHPDLPADLGQTAVELAQTAGEAARAARLLVAAAAEARWRGALSTAEAFLQRARALTGTGAAAAEIDLALTQVLAAAGKPVAALEVGERLFRPHSGLDPDQAPALRLVLARAATLAGLWRRAEGHLAEARSCPPASGPASQAEADLVEAHTLMAQKRTAGATSLARQALEAAREANLAGIAAEALMIVGQADRLRDLASARAAFSEALEWAERAGSVEAVIRATFELATVPLLDGGPIEPLLEARRSALDAGVPVTAAYVDLMLAHRHEDDMELELARQAAQRSVDAARRYRLDPLLGSASTQLALAHGALGDRRAMEEALATASGAAGDDPDVVAGSCIARAMVTLLLDEDRPSGLRHLDAAMDVLRSSQATYPAPHRGLWALLHVVEDDEVGDRAVAEVRESPAMVHRAVQGLLACADAVRLGRRGRGAEAEEVWARGDADLSYSPGRQNLARRLVAEAAIRDRWGDPVSWLREAEGFFEEKGLTRVAVACRSLLRTTGARVGTRARSHEGMPEQLRHAGVTRRELEVLDLLAEGLSTSTIAGRLYLSIKTVERHTANLATKLGLNGRAHVVAYAATRRGSLGSGSGFEGTSAPRMGDAPMR